MRLYSRSDEERLQLESLVDEWTRSQLLDAAQGERLAAEVRVDLRRTNPFLRAGLALFTTLIIGAAVGLVLVTFNIWREESVASVAFAAALVCIALAELAARAGRCHRFGVEEALAVGGVVLLAVSAALTMSHAGFLGRMATAGLTVGAVGGLGLYVRFGLVYAATGAMVCAAIVPFSLDLPALLQHVAGAALLAVVGLAARFQRRRYQHDHPGQEYGMLQAAAWIGIYLVLNLQITGQSQGVARAAFWLSDAANGANRLFYWFTYLVIWVMPAAGVWRALGERDRELLDASLVIALLTIVTNKPYLGWPRHEWDPILLGVLLMAIATAVRRWLARGPNGERSGFTPVRVLDRDRALLGDVSTASAVVPPVAATPHTPPPDPGFHGGRSGGGGGGDSF